jgi:proteasome accessory factor B
MAMPVVERLVNLTIALLETRRPLTFDELRRRTNYYPQADAASARRMFERDKDALRTLGIPVETRQDFGMDDPGYLIDRRTYELRGVDLDAEEVAALAVAVEMLDAQEGALPLAKVAARAPDPAPLDAPPTRVDLPVTDVDSFAGAIVERRAVRFGYRTADGRSGVRTVEPYGIVRRRRAWYLVGRDRDREGPRGFRTDRMLGAFEVLEPPAAFDVPEDLDLGAVVSGPEVPTVDVQFDADTEGQWALRARGGRDEGAGPDGTRRLTVHGVDPLRDRAWLLGIAPDAAVVAPDELRDTVAQALGRVVDAHRDVARPGADPEGREGER